MQQYQEYLQKFLVYALPFLTKVFYALLIVIIGKWVAKVISRIVEKALLRSKVNKTLATFTKNIAYYVLLLFVIIAALSKIGVETTSFIALIGAAGLAVGLALQGSLANFAAGVMIVLFQPFGIGDVVDAGGASGTVEEIQIFNTIIMAPDNKRIIVPNAKITSEKITVHLEASKKT
jgi:small conductance mechanosensitive channel